MKKRLLSFALSLLIGGGMLPLTLLTASAADTVSGTFGNCLWEIADGVLTVSPIAGSDGKLAATTTESPWKAYSTSISSVEIAEGVVADAQSPYLFSNLKSATTMKLQNLDTSNVTNMEGMFSGCSSLDIVYAGTWDTGSVTDMSNLFRNCFSLRTLTVSDWDTANVEDMSYAFAGCSQSQTLALTYWSTEAVKNIDCIFAGTSLLATLCIGGGWNIAAAENNTDIFADTALTEIQYYGTCRQWVDNCAWYTYPCDITYSNVNMSVNDHIDASGDGDHICEICDRRVGYYVCKDSDSDDDHLCDECGDSTGNVTECYDLDGDYACDVCGMRDVIAVEYPESITAAVGETVTVDITPFGEISHYIWAIKDSKDTYLNTVFTEDFYYSFEMKEEYVGGYIFCRIIGVDDNLSYSIVEIPIKNATPVAITEQPQNVTVAKGETAKVTVTATGEGLTYKWYFKNAGATKFTYTSSFKGASYWVTMNDDRAGRQIYCVITDKYGNSVTTDTVTLGMIQPVTITKQPVSVTVAEGETARVTVTATGEGLTYKWYYKNANMSSFAYTSTYKGASYWLTMNDTRAGRQIYCVITDKYGNSVTTNTVRLGMTPTVTDPDHPPAMLTIIDDDGHIGFMNDLLPIIESRGISIATAVTTTRVGSAAKWMTWEQILECQSRGAEVLCHTYDHNPTIPATVEELTAQYTFARDEMYRHGLHGADILVYNNVTGKQPNAQEAAANVFKCAIHSSGRVMNYKGDINPYYIQRIPVELDPYLYDTDKLKALIDDAVANGGWMVWIIHTSAASWSDHNGAQAIADSVDYAIDMGLPIVSADFGYQHYVENTEQLSVVQQPTDITVSEGETARVTVTATGDGLTYKWYYKNANMSSFAYTSSYKGASYWLTMNETRAGRQIYCVITDKYGNSVTTDVVTLGMMQPVMITQQPTDITVAEGETARVTVTATGDGLTYKWYYKNANMSSFAYTSSYKGASYWLTMNETRAGRQIYCVITDKYGNSVTTDVVTLGMAS